MTYQIQSFTDTVDHAKNFVSAQARAIRYAEEHPGKRVWVFRDQETQWVLAVYVEGGELQIVVRDEQENRP